MVVTMTSAETPVKSQYSVRSLVTKWGGPHFWNGKTTCRDHQRLGVVFSGIGPHHELSRAADLPDNRIGNDYDARGRAFGFEHVDNILSGAVAEELSQRLFVVGNAIILNQCNEVRGRVTGKRGFGKMQIGGEKIFRPAI